MTNLLRINNYYHIITSMKRVAYPCHVLKKLVVPLLLPILKKKLNKEISVKLLSGELQFKGKY